MNANLILLALCQGLFLTNNVTFIAINGLVGLSLAPLGWMATLPVMGYVVGGALSTGLVAKSQSRWGRKGSFQLGLLVALLSALLAAYAAYSHNFWLLVAATVIAGYYSANGQLYRFAAAELAQAQFREKAVSLVMAGGLIGAIIGPNLASRTKGLFETPFMGAYLALMAVALMAMVLMAFIRFPAEPPKAAGASGGRPLREIMAQPVFIVSAAAAALSYGVMNLLMAATPLAMQVCGFGFGDAALVLWPESGVPDYLRDGYPPYYYADTTWGADPALARARLGRAAGPGSLLLTGCAATQVQSTGELLRGPLCQRGSTPVSARARRCGTNRTGLWWCSAPSTPPPSCQTITSCPPCSPAMW